MCHKRSIIKANWSSSFLSDPDNLLRNVYEDVGSSICRGNEAMAFGATEAFADTFVDGALRCSHSSAKT